MTDTNEEKQRGQSPRFEGEIWTPTGDAKPTDMDANLDRWAMGSLYGVADLDGDRSRELVGLATLPPWPEWPPSDGSPMATGHGLGEMLEHYLGGGFAPGEMYVLGAAQAKAGKTALVMQLAEGLALRSAAVALGAVGLGRLGQGLSRPEGAVVEAAAEGLKRYGQALTPVVLVSEMPANVLSRRWLARWCGGSASWFRAGQTALRGKGPNEAGEILEVWQRAREALGAGLLAEARREHMLMIPGADVREGGTGEAWKPGLYVERWASRLRERYRRDVVPVLVIDPVQRFQGGTTDNEVSALSAFAATLREWTVGQGPGQAGGWVTLLTSDATKDTAKGRAEREGDDMATAVLRGSYHLTHEVSGVFVLNAPPRSCVNGAKAEPGDNEKDAKRLELNREASEKCSAYSEALRAARVEVQLTVAYNRNGPNTGGQGAPAPRFDWWPALQRFYPLDRAEVDKRRKLADGVAAEVAKPAGGGSGRGGSTPTTKVDTRGLV